MRREHRGALAQWQSSRLLPGRSGFDPLMPYHRTLLVRDGDVRLACGTDIRSEERRVEIRSRKADEDRVRRESDTALSTIYRTGPTARTLGSEPGSWGSIPWSGSFSPPQGVAASPTAVRLRCNGRSLTTGDAERFCARSVHGDRAEVCTPGCDPGRRGVRVPSVTPATRVFKACVASRHRSSG